MKAQTIGANLGALTRHFLLLGIFASSAYADPIRIDFLISFTPPDASFSPFSGVVTLVAVESGVTRTLAVTPVEGFNAPESFGFYYDATGDLDPLAVIEFDFVGTAGGAPAFAFPGGRDVPDTVPSNPPRIPIPIPSDPLQTLSMEGPIYAFRSPGTQVGTWSTTVATIPEPSSFVLLGSLGLLLALTKVGKARLIMPGSSLKVSGP